MSIHELRSIFGDIIRGYSKFTYGSKLLYIRHLDQFSLSEVDSHYPIFYNAALSKGLLPEAERMAYLRKIGQWTDKDDSAIKEAQEMLAGLETTRKKLFLESQIAQNAQDIRREKANLTVKFSRKHNLLGITAESTANKETSGLYLFNTIFKDMNCTVPYLTLEEFESLSDTEYESLDKVFNETLVRFNTTNIKKLALTVFVLNLLGLCGENIMNFYGKPIIKLTIYEEELLRWARKYQFLLSKNENIPEYLFEDPEQFQNWCESGEQLREVIEKAQSKGGETNIIGLSQKDKEKLGPSKVNSGISALINKAKEKLNPSK